MFSVTKVKHVCDLEDNRLFKIRNKWFNFFVHKAYIYDENKKKIATVKDKWFNTKGEYFVLGYKDEIKIQGNFFGLTSQILKTAKWWAQSVGKWQSLPIASNLKQMKKICHSLLP